MALPAQEWRAVPVAGVRPSGRRSTQTLCRTARTWKRSRACRMDINRNAPAIASVEAYVEAPLSVVWAVHTDLRVWPEWNSDVASITFSGPLSPGTQFRWKAGGVPITSTLQKVDPERQIGWTGRTPLGIHAVHTWTFEPEGEGTRVRTEESFDGFLVRILAGPMRRMLAASLDRGVAALKREAERRAREGAAPRVSAIM